MGRKTFDSIGKALPNRKNIVLSHHPTSLPDSVVGVGSLSELQAIFETHPNENFILLEEVIYTMPCYHKLMNF
ncbi:Dihydrofolate reductase [Pediococcus pentosaceus]|uniref:Dihydrofolate reductase n=1 Tax=Pediococcus pentosaceus TaxID=1255 RepID=A0A1Y0VUX7_PEDPE|nr:Dihydrofolate reductase [Pediococcus pentosaceus]